MGKLSRAEKKALKKQNSLLKVEDTCINCSEHIALDQRFCSFCGGKRIYNKLTWRNLLEDFADRFLNLENSFLKTFIALFKQPEDVIGGYMKGMRKKYLPAFSYFAIAITLSGFYFFILQGWFLEEQIAAQSLLQGENVSEAQVQLQREITNGLGEYQSLYMFLTIPFLALIAKLVFWNYKNFNLIEHFVIFLYAYSHVSIISVVLQILFLWSPLLLGILSVLNIFIMFLYAAYVLTAMYRLNLAQIIVKSLLFFVVFTIFSCFIMSPFAYLGFKSAVKSKKGEKVEFDESTRLGRIFSLVTKDAEYQSKLKKQRDSLKQNLKDSIYIDSVLKTNYKARDTLK